MDEYSILADLKRSVDKQIQLQEEANGIMRGLVDALRCVAQETLDLRKHLEKSME